MAGKSILLLLVCGAALTQARYRRSNVNSNVNTNTNYLGGGMSPLSPYKEVDDESPYVILDNVRRKLRDENDEATASIAGAAAEASLVVTNGLLRDLNEAIANTVSQAVVRAIKERSAAIAQSRRNINSNVNSNNNVIGGGYGQNEQNPERRYPSRYGYDGQRSYIPRRYRDEEAAAAAEETQDSEAGDGLLDAILGTAVGNDESDQQVAVEEENKENPIGKSRASTNWGKLNYPDYRESGEAGNANSNINSNTNFNSNVNSFRRNARSRRRDQNRRRRF